ncbi:MAG: hypothetical protein KF900_09435 [Bacteroidetes bacterium]|nr:hypothetical protein [Bacteroidota bacterium]
MEAIIQVKLESLEPYRHLFPKATAIDKTMKKGANVADTVKFIPQVVKKTQWQVEAYVNQELRGLPMYAACEKLWHFVKYHIRYQKDERGQEQVRSPRRLIHDGVGDCDCFTTFISTCLTSLGFRVIHRITKYWKDNFQHIYPIVPLGNGNYITMDCVVNRFNYEEPYSEKKDFKMDLHYLDGIEDETENRTRGNVDMQTFSGMNGEFGDLGKLFKKKASAAPSKPKPKPLQKLKTKIAAAKPKLAAIKPKLPAKTKENLKKNLQKAKQVTKKVLNVTNKVNPATALLRAGVLASMKLNVLHVAENLKWAYLSEDQARAKGMDMTKYGKLKNILTKTENIFYTAGGKPENLKQAILSGKGNPNKEVSGLGLIDENEIGTTDLGATDNLGELLGEVYRDEFIEGMGEMEGLGELGAVTATAAITAATAVMGSIAALIKSLGNLFPNKKAKAAKAAAANNKPTSASTAANNNRTSAAEENSDASASEDGEATVRTSGGGESSTSENYSADTSSNYDEGGEDTDYSAQSRSAAPNDTDEDNMNEETPSTNNALPAASKTTNTATANSNTASTVSKAGKIKAFWENNKKWLKPVGIGVGVAGVLYAGYRMIAGKNKTKKKSSGGGNGLNGVGKRSGKKRKRKTGKRQSRQGKKSNIALM